MTDSMFKSCSCCDREWPTREAFLDDPSIVAIGYQPDFRALRLGLFFFNHELCRTTLALPAHDFLDLSDGPAFKERKIASPDCPGFCLNADDLEPCPAACECAFVRDVLQILRHS
jgi:hypothetical protein